jgi:hypothetical protein
MSDSISSYGSTMIYAVLIGERKAPVRLIKQGKDENVKSLAKFDKFIRQDHDP